MPGLYKLKAPTLGPLARYVANGISLTGISVDPVIYTNDFLENKLPPGWTENVGSGGNSQYVSGVDGGQSNLITSAGAGGICSQFMAASGSGGIANSNTSKFYCAWRQQLPNAVTANTRCGSGFFNGAATIMAGVYGGLSVANFVVQFNGIRTGSALTLGVIDANLHVFEFWHNGDGILRGRQDGGTIQTGAAPNNANQGAYSEVYNNAAAEDHRLIRDWCVYVTGRS